ncbi:MAG: tol-pal system protein YbgF [Pseudomonadota bacterium]|nr:tol-pal system protein YbgF [Pseudomonadota bacterium]MDP1905639.1 tol-pal system protein YbgF [Pseudomonadota bacterium]
MNRMARIAWVAALIAVPGAHAGPLEDALAQTAELRTSVKTQQERITRLEAQAQNKGVIGLLNEVEALKAEMARLRGFQEEQAYQMDVAEKRVKDLFIDLDTRVTQLKGMANRVTPVQGEAIRLQPAQSLANVPAPIVPVDPEEESRAYSAAHGLVKGGKYQEAAQAMQDFLVKYPNGTLAPNAVYWRGFSQVNLGDFPGAATSYQKLIDDYPTSSKAPDAMLSLARARIQSNELALARVVLDQLIAKYPISKAAATGKKLLATLN